MVPSLSMPLDPLWEIMACPVDHRFHHWTPDSSLGWGNPGSPPGTQRVLAVDEVQGQLSPAGGARLERPRQRGALEPVPGFGYGGICPNQHLHGRCRFSLFFLHMSPSGSPSFDTHTHTFPLKALASFPWFHGSRLADPFCHVLPTVLRCACAWSTWHLQGGGRFEDAACFAIPREDRRAAFDWPRLQEAVVHASTPPAASACRLPRSFTQVQSQPCLLHLVLPPWGFSN